VRLEIYGIFIFSFLLVVTQQASTRSCYYFHFKMSIYRIVAAGGNYWTW